MRRLVLDIPDRVVDQLLIKATDERRQLKSQIVYMLEQDTKHIEQVANGSADRPTADAR